MNAAGKRSMVVSTLARLRRRKANIARIALVDAQVSAANTRKRMDVLSDAMSASNASVRDMLGMADQFGQMAAYRKQIAAIRGELSACQARAAADSHTLAKRRAELAMAIRQSRALHRAQQRLAARKAASIAARRQRELEEIHAANAACVTQGRETGGAI